MQVASQIAKSPDFPGRSPRDSIEEAEAAWLGKRGYTRTHGQVLGSPCYLRCAAG